MHLETWLANRSVDELREMQEVVSPVLPVDVKYDFRRPQMFQKRVGYSDIQVENVWLTMTFISTGTPGKQNLSVFMSQMKSTSGTKWVGN